ncbi:MAG: DUF2125 domain-containing protein [Pseudomonadota bacterium]
MRFIIWIMAFATIGWCGYWVLAQSAIEKGARGWFEERRADGWAADVAEVETRGFPYRFDTVLIDVSLADPETGVLWSLPTLDVRALAYRPAHVIAIFPPRQTLASPFGTLTLESEDMRASLRLAGTRLAVQETTAEIAELSARSSQGWEVTLDRALVAARAGEGENSYDLFVDAAGLRPSDALRLTLSPQGRLPDTFETLTLDATAAFDVPWDRFAIEEARPQPTRIELRGFEARWGQLELSAEGGLEIAPDGTPEGRVGLVATNWREILSLGAATGLIPQGVMPTATRTLEALASLSGGPNTIDLPLVFAGGTLSLGPIQLGPAPRIRLR